MLQFEESQKIPDGPYGPMIYEASRRHSLNPQVVAALIHTESAGNPRAINTTVANQRTVTVGPTTCSNVQFGNVQRILPVPAHVFDFLTKLDLTLGSNTISGRYLFNRNNNVNATGTGSTGDFSISSLSAETTTLKSKDHRSGELPGLRRHPAEPGSDGRSGREGHDLAGGLDGGGLREPRHHEVDVLRGDSRLFRGGVEEPRQVPFGGAGRAAVGVLVEPAALRGTERRGLQEGLGRRAAGRGIVPGVSGAEPLFQGQGGQFLAHGETPSADCRASHRPKRRLSLRPPLTM